MRFNHAAAEGDVGLPPPALRSSSVERRGSTPSTRSVRSRVSWLSPDFLRNLISQSTDPWPITARFHYRFSVSSSGVVFLVPHALAAWAALCLPFLHSAASIYSPSRIGIDNPGAPVSHHEVVFYEGRISVAVFYLDVAHVASVYLNVAYVSHTCCKCFIQMLHMFHT
jgi:hypothetical protein